MDDLYRENILDHYRHPRGKGRLENPTHSFHDENPLCGDDIHIDLHVDDNDIIGYYCDLNRLGKEGSHDCRP